mmetsp:Transcript_13251/g.38187  ORF Transcript_13251/g.38187 Transcript_13251/m.38187 type:complete len:232 (-) Transcript_13251:29-724(-)
MDGRTHRQTDGRRGQRLRRLHQLRGVRRLAHGRGPGVGGGPSGGLPQRGPRLPQGGPHRGTSEHQNRRGDRLRAGEPGGRRRGQARHPGRQLGRENAEDHEAQAGGLSQCVEHPEPVAADPGRRQDHRHQRDPQQREVVSQGAEEEGPPRHHHPAERGRSHVFAQGQRLLRSSAHRARGGCLQRCPQGCSEEHRREVRGEEHAQEGHAEGGSRAHGQDHEAAGPPEHREVV